MDLQKIRFLNDNEKLDILENYNADSDRMMIISTLENDENIYKALDKLRNDFYISKAAKMISDIKIKLKAIAKVRARSLKEAVANTLGKDWQKVDIIKNIPNKAMRVLIAKTISEGKYLSEAFNYLDSERDKIKVIKARLDYTFENKELLDEVIDYIEGSKNKAELLALLEKDSDSFDLINKYNIELDIDDKISVVKSLYYAEQIKNENDLTEDQLIKLGARIQSIEDQYSWFKNETNLSERLEKLTEKKYESKGLDLPPELTFGVEIEVEGVHFKTVKEIIDNQSVKKDILKNWKIEEDTSLNYGAEFISPVLNSNLESMQQLDYIFDFIQTIGERAEDTCGGHVHIGVDQYFGKDLQAWENFFIIWKESEELLYKISNPAESSPRELTINYADTQDKNFRRLNKDGSINIKTKEDLENVIEELGIDKFYGLNVTNLGDEKKNTIEFRIPNGTTDVNVERENILLYGKLVQVSKQILSNKKLQEKFEIFKQHDLTEAEKLESLLDLLFTDEKCKEIYRYRWNSAKDYEIFDELKSSNPTFKRKDYTISTEKLYNETLKEQENTILKKEIEKVIDKQEKSFRIGGRNE